MEKPNSEMSELINRFDKDSELARKIEGLGLERLINLDPSKTLFTFWREPTGEYPVLYVFVGRSKDDYSVEVNTIPPDKDYSDSTDLSIKEKEVVDQIIIFLTELESKYVGIFTDNDKTYKPAKI